MLQDMHLATVVEVLQSIKQADMSPMLGRIYSSPGGIELLDALMKYLYVPVLSLSHCAGYPYICAMKNLTDLPPYKAIRGCHNLQRVPLESFHHRPPDFRRSSREGLPREVGRL